jgi:hypothetical protein
MNDSPALAAGRRAGCVRGAGWEREAWRPLLVGLVFPVVLGAGKRLFGEGVTPTAFELSATRATPKGVT